MRLVQRVRAFVAPPTEPAPPWMGAGNAVCECGHSERYHIMWSQQQRCEAMVYTNAPLGGGSSYQCPCSQFSETA